MLLEATAPQVTADQPPDVEAAIADLGTEPVLKLADQTKINGKRVRWVGVNNGVWVDFEINDKWYFVRADTVEQYLEELLWLLWTIETNNQPQTA
ncbi:MAG: hypothetical protein KatS3mg109_0772 [Pirellulaceae bacterium]|nr:MAG: hypothetical protein KatS3mg109_0772 [Pirellulaceae bacterium]